MGTRVIVQTTDARGLVTVEVVSFRLGGPARELDSVALELSLRQAVRERSRELGCSGWEVL